MGVNAATRPWGFFEVLARGPGWGLKRIVVRAGHRCSLQYHLNRSEAWLVIQGRGQAIIGARQPRLFPGRVVRIPRGVQHRIENAGPGDLRLMELQLGRVLSEEDIVRIEDDYGRTGQGREATLLERA